MTSSTPTHLAVTLDDFDLPADVIDALAVQQFASGDHPWAKTSRIDRVRPDATLLPPGVLPSRQAFDRTRRSHMASGAGWTLVATCWTDESATVTVTAASAAVGGPVLDAAVAGAAVEAKVDDDKLEIGFWHLGRNPDRRQRPVSTQPWPTVRRNYTAPVAAAFDQLAAVQPETLSGRLLLLHGPPGTGKTTALRTLARSWRPWCQFDYVLDPELLLANPAYLLHVSMARADGDRWRLLILEDCDELIRGDAKQGTGQALARLLNLTDGLLGQGVDLIVAISTNEPLSRLHPAVVRPGRCIAQVEVGPLTRSEASAWLGPAGTASGPMTLADLYARRGDQHSVAHRADAAPTGLYL